jgi:hypothetical protein
MCLRTVLPSFPRKREPIFQAGVYGSPLAPDLIGGLRGDDNHIHWQSDAA